MMIPTVRPSYVSIKSPSNIHKVLVIPGDNGGVLVSVRVFSVGGGSVILCTEPWAPRAPPRSCSPTPKVTFHPATDHNHSFSFSILNLGFRKQWSQDQSGNGGLDGQKVAMGCVLERESSGPRKHMGWRGGHFYRTPLKEFTNGHLRFTEFFRTW